jgi:hypothetical protein
VPLRATARCRRDAGDNPLQNTTRATASGALAALLLSVSACSPTFNWRELRVDGTPLRALMPCKPERATRAVPLLAAPAEPVALHMHSCEAGGLRFAVAWADVGQPAQVTPALAAWRQAGLQAIRAVEAAAADNPMRLPGADVVQPLQAQGTDPQGQAVQTRAVYFAQGGQVYQAAVYGPRLPDEAVDAFFAGLAFAAP